MDKLVLKWQIIFDCLINHQRRNRGCDMTRTVNKVEILKEDYSRVLEVTSTQIDALKEQLISFKDQLTHKDDEIESLKTDLHNEFDRINQLAKETSLMSSKIEAEKEANYELRKLNESLQDLQLKEKCNYLEEKTKDLEAKLKSKTELLEIYSKDKRQQDGILHNLEVHNKELSEKLDHSLKAHKHTTEELSEAKKNVSSLSKKVKEQSTEIIQLNELLEDVTKSMSFEIEMKYQAMQELEELKAKEHELEKQLNLLQDQLSHHVQETTSQVASSQPNPDEKDKSIFLEGLPKPPQSPILPPISFFYPTTAVQKSDKSTTTESTPPTKNIILKHALRKLSGNEYGPTSANMNISPKNLNASPGDHSFEHHNQLAKNIEFSIKDEKISEIEVSVNDIKGKENGEGSQVHNVSVAMDDFFTQDYSKVSNSRKRIDLSSRIQSIIPSSKPNSTKARLRHLPSFGAESKLFEKIEDKQSTKDALINQSKILNKKFKTCRGEGTTNKNDIFTLPLPLVFPKTVMQKKQTPTNPADKSPSLIGNFDDERLSSNNLKIEPTPFQIKSENTDLKSQVDATRQLQKKKNTITSKVKDYFEEEAVERKKHHKDKINILFDEKKYFMHDYLNLATNVNLRKLVESKGEYMGLLDVYTDFILKNNSQGDREVQVVYLTSTHLFFLLPSKKMDEFKLALELENSDLKSVQVSSQNTTLLKIITKDGKDYVFESFRRTTFALEMKKRVQAVNQGFRIEEVLSKVIVPDILVYASPLQSQLEFLFDKGVKTGLVKRLTSGFFTYYEMHTIIILTELGLLLIDAHNFTDSEFVPLMDFEISDCNYQQQQNNNAVEIRCSRCFDNPLVLIFSSNIEKQAWVTSLFKYKVTPLSAA